MKTKTISTKIVALIICLALLFSLTVTPAEIAFADIAVDGLTVTGGESDTDYTYASGVLTILTDAALTISGTTTTDKIVVTATTANISLDDLNIDVSGTSKATAFSISSGSTVNLTIVDGSTNVLKSGANSAGLESSEGTMLKIYGGTEETGTLTAVGGNYGAGIGGSTGEAGGTIEIISGQIFATGGSSAAGIGGGKASASGAITISGGEVTTTAGSNAASIGGSGTNNGTITISGGVVYANEYNYDN